MDFFKIQNNGCPGKQISNPCAPSCYCVAGRRSRTAWPGTRPVIDHISPDLLADRTDHMFETPYTSAPIGQPGPAHFDGAYRQEQPLKDAVRDYEKWLIRQAIQTNGSYSKAAKALGIDKSTLIRKLR